MALNKCGASEGTSGWKIKGGCEVMSMRRKESASIFKVELDPTS